MRILIILKTTVEIFSSFVKLMGLAQWKCAETETGAVLLPIKNSFGDPEKVGHMNMRP